MVAGVTIANIGTWQFDLGLMRVFGYHIFTALTLCIVFPLYYTVRVEGGALEDIGLGWRNWRYAVAVGIVIAAIMTPWRINGLEVPEAYDLFYLVIALSMSTLFEEIFFRGFVQIRMERWAGRWAAVLISSFAFAIYHVGYGIEYQSIASLGRMTLVGMLFATVFAISKSVYTSFIVNLPHALITFLEQGRRFDEKAAVVSGRIIVAGVTAIVIARRFSTSIET